MIWRDRLSLIVTIAMLECGVYAGELRACAEDERIVGDPVSQQVLPIRRIAAARVPAERCARYPITASLFSLGVLLPPEYGLAFPGGGGALVWRAQVRGLRAFLTGPQGGNDKLCRISLRLRALRTIIAEAVHRDLYLAIDGTATKLKETVSGCVSRKQATSRHRTSRRDQRVRW